MGHWKNRWIQTPQRILMDPCFKQAPVLSKRFWIIPWPLAYNRLELDCIKKKIINFWYTFGWKWRVFMTIWDCPTHVRMTLMTSSVERTDLDFKISVALVITLLLNTLQKMLLALTIVQTKYQKTECKATKGCIFCRFLNSQLLIWATSWENLFMTCANNKGADQSAHPRSLISTFVVRCLDSILPLVSISELSSLCLASLAAQAGLCPTWSQTPKTGFLVTRLILSRFMWNALLLRRQTIKAHASLCI